MARLLTRVLVTLAVTWASLQLTASAPAELGASEPAAPQPGLEVSLADGADSDRSSRAVEHVKSAKFGIKNYLLDLIFGKINQAIDAKTRFVAQLDRLNIEKNRNLLASDCERGGASVTASAGFAGYPSGPAPSSSGSASAGLSAGAGVSLFG
ncbi:uncharacterized protein LOC134536260 isoform X2 [Bacillus rossius redtenbacheri]|uniref:uncharacterized protein LOC134536260 isoform X2 n=1 Tax=Bacillus rossius redtenbacheri TaxID=93214 RepID=UPI002FDC901A